MVFSALLKLLDYSIICGFIVYLEHKIPNLNLITLLLLNLLNNT